MYEVELGPDAWLRPLEPVHAQAFLAQVEVDRADLRPWIPFASRIFDVAGARELLERYAVERAADRGRLFGIWLDGRLVGGTLFKYFDTDSGVCEVGVWLSRSAQGRGLVYTAARKMIDWAIEERGMARVEWRTDTRNEPSRRAARRLGMRPEGVLRANFVLEGQRYDTEVWAVLASEWPTPLWSSLAA